MPSDRKPQLEDGFTRIANELLDAMISFDFSKRDQKIILVVIRKTYGFGKKSDDMTLTQIANATGLNLAHVSTTVKDLSARNILLKRQGKYGYILGINKDYGEWTTLPKQQGVTETASKPYQNSNQTLPKQQPQKKLPIETIKRDTSFDEFWMAYPKKLAKLAAEKAWNKAKISSDFQIVMHALSIHKLSDQWRNDGGKYIPNPSTWINQRRWEDELHVSGNQQRGLVL